jgi:hypothetical protein
MAEKPKTLNSKRGAGAPAGTPAEAPEDAAADRPADRAAELAESQGEGLAVVAPEIAAQVGETRYLLEPTPTAARAILRTFGGRFTTHLEEALRNGDLDAMVATIAAGTGATMTQPEKEELWNALWRLDLGACVEVGVQCRTFIAVLKNGGRPLPSKDKSPSKDKGPGKHKSGKGKSGNA